MSTLLPDLCSVTEKKAGTPPKTTRKKCIHGKRKHRCKLCGGSAFCLHDRRKDMCKQCGGSQICQHGKRKAECRPCRGSSICPHGTSKFSCKSCGGSKFCQHGKQKDVCRTCGGSRICQHGRPKERCQQCGGNQICQHGRLKYRCHVCGGSQICQHGRLKYDCHVCGGNRICQHGRRKERCPECGGTSICSNCHFVVVMKRGGLCASCRPTPNIRSRCREVKLAGTLDQWADDDKISKYTTWNKQNQLADPLQCGKYRVDFTFETPSGVVFLECDEKQHSEYVKRCELVRQAEVALGYGGLPVHWIRYNPDAFKINGTTRVTKRGERESTLLRNLQLALTRPDYEHFITVTYICYDNPGTTNEDPDALVQRHVFKTVEDYNAWVEKSS